MGCPRLHDSGGRRLHRPGTPVGRVFACPSGRRHHHFRAKFNGRLHHDEHCRAVDRVLLILLVVELLYTVQVSFREHALMPEPFLLIGLIAGIRRVLLLTAELAQVHEKSDVFQHIIVELVVLTVMIVALVISLVLLRKRSGSVTEHAK